MIFYETNSSKTAYIRNKNYIRLDVQWFYSCKLIISHAMIIADAAIFILTSFETCQGYCHPFSQIHFSKARAQDDATINICSRKNRKKIGVVSLCSAMGFSFVAFCNPFQSRRRIKY